MLILQKQSDLPIIIGDTEYHGHTALVNRTDRKLLIGFRDRRETFPHHSGCPWLTGTFQDPDLLSSFLGKRTGCPQQA
jgi:hypothetical protein